MVQQSGGAQGAVPDQFGGQAQPDLPRQQRIGGIALDQLLRAARGLLVGFRGDNQAMHVPNIPARVAKLGSEPVQQSRMARTFALRSEILGSRHQAPPEVLLPDPIDSDARRQRIVVREQPAGEFEPPGACPSRFGQNSGRARADFDAVPVPAAAHAQEGGLPLAILVDDARLATLRVRLVELLELAQRLGEAQLLALGRADDQTVGAQEVVRHHVGLAPGPSVRRDPHDLLPAIGVQAKFLPS